MEYLVNINDYIKYVDNFGSDKIDSNNKIWTQSKSNLLSTNEIFDSGGYESEYTIDKIKSDYLIKFASTSGQEYRLDLIYDIDNYNVYHLAFSTSDKGINDIDYEKPTDKKETLELLNRLMWIIKDINLEGAEFCIGATGSKKDDIYKYMLRYVSKWEKRDCDYYKLGWGIYFSL